VTNRTARALNSSSYLFAMMQTTFPRKKVCIKPGVVQYPNPANAAAPFYDEVSRDAGYERDSQKLTPTNVGNEVWFMTIAAQYLCDGPAPAPSQPIATAGPTTTNSQNLNGPTIGDECSDWMKFSIDPISGQEMLCSGYSGNLSRGDSTKWYSAEEGAAGPSAGWASAPRVGITGSPCSEPPFTFGRSSDGYAVWCHSGSRALMPGLEWLSTPDERPVWALYSP
jgi:hypothetical protein